MSVHINSQGNIETKRGVTDNSSSRIFQGPENAQGEYANYLNVMHSMRAKLRLIVSGDKKLSYVAFFCYNPSNMLYLI